MTTFNKDPVAVSDYGFNWALWMSSGDAISSSVFSAGALTVSSQSVSSYRTTCFISGGSEGTQHRVTNRIVTTQGRIVEKSFDMKIIHL